VKDVQGKTAFITGGASGIGLGIAKSFVNAGMNVVLADLRQDHLDTALAGFKSRGQSASVHAIRLDVTDRPGMAAAADETERVFGKLHVIVNNAGVGIEGPLKDATYDDWDFGMGVNLGGVINGVQTFVPRIRKHGEGGHVVNTASLAALVTMPANMVMYVTAKAAVVALSESIRTELTQENIGVTVLCPGPVKSNIHELERNRPERFVQSSAFEESAKRLGKRIVSPLWMEPEEVGEMILNAVRTDTLYVITHGECRDAVVSRFEAILAAMPEKVNPELIASLRAPARKA
jgi:NAD(P)-dependent dehydrogenase (short-subunit alcohol dehydrogenase family)